MSARALRLRLLVAVVLALAPVGQLQPVCPAGEGPDTPFAIELSEDVDTRGDWIGTYGSYTYVLCGMRAPHSLYGGAGWPVKFSAATSDPKETVRAWQSSAPAKGDRSVLLEPNGITRTPGAFDDHGEARPLGKGPDLHLKIAVPQGASLLSLYFFEIDWPQYRSHRIRLFAGGTSQKPLLETTADNFLKGKYKRFVVYGPADLLVVIERGQSPNAQVSGIFLDRLKFPSTFILNAADPITSSQHTGEGKGPFPQRDAADRAAAQALARLLQDPNSEKARRSYLDSERTVIFSLQELERSRPQLYYSQVRSLWLPTWERLGKAAAVLGRGREAFEAEILGYIAARGQFDYEGARQELGRIAADLVAEPLDPSLLVKTQADVLDRILAHTMDEGRRGEALILLEAYASYCVAGEEPETGLSDLVRVGKRAQYAGVPLPAARALELWKAQHGELSQDNRLLLANLYYVGGKSEDALALYKTVEAGMGSSRSHRWVLIAMLSSALKLRRVEEAKALLERLENSYPGAEEIDEAKYRFGVHYFEVGDLAAARKCFEDLRAATKSAIYKKLCGEYVDRIAHLEKIGGARSGGK